MDGLPCRLPELNSAKELSKKASDKTHAERRETGKGSEVGQREREENSRKWWRFWGESDPETSNINQPTEEAAEQPRNRNNKWWKPWGKNEPERKATEEDTETAPEQREANGRKWWKPW